MIKVKLFYKLLNTGLLLLLMILTSGSGVRADNSSGTSPKSVSETTIEALGGVDYDSETNITTANTKAKLTNDLVTIEADLITYNAGTGDVSASGAVTITRQDGICHSEKLIYNIKNTTGSTGLFHGVLYGQDRNTVIRGASLDLTHDFYSVSKGIVTLCPKEKPHYILTAKKITFQGEQIVVRGAVLKVWGIPIFYFPRLSFHVEDDKIHMDLYNFPVQFESGYNATDGVWLKGVYNYEVNERLRWYLSGKIISNRTDNDHQVEAGLTRHGAMGRGAFNDTFSIVKRISGDYKLADSFSYSGSSFSTAIDAYYDFAPANKNELGFSLTRNYWPSFIGNWQLGVQARRVGAYEGKPNEYGGIFGGYRVDYQPFNNVTLSYQRLDDLSRKNNFGDFSPNIGSSVMLGLGKTVGVYNRFNIYGSYNIDTQKVSGQIDWKTCCYDSYVGWDATKQSVTFGLTYHF